MDKSAEYNSGTFDTYEKAVTKCKVILDDFLESAYQPGETAEQLYDTYIMFGETPIVWGQDLGDYDANEYARIKCLEICKPNQTRINKFVRDIDRD